MTTFKGSIAPRSYDALWLTRELSRIEQKFANDAPYLQFQYLAEEPSRCIPGMEVLADGENWNPGWGRGKYIRDADNASWIWIGGDLVGSGGSVTQTVDKTTGVTLNAPTGRITLAAGSLAAGAITRFTLTNSFIGVNDGVHVQRIQGGTGGIYTVWSDATAVAGGACFINVKNEDSVARNETPILMFRVIKGDA